MRLVWRALLIVVGTISLLMGIVGIFLPLWPTTPFLLLTAVCYVRSSERLYRWLLDHRHLGRYVRDFVSGRGIPLKAIAYTLGLAFIGAGVHYYIGYHIPTRSSDEPSPVCEVAPNGD